MVLVREPSVEMLDVIQPFIEKFYYQTVYHSKLNIELNHADVKEVISNLILSKDAVLAIAEDVDNNILGATCIIKTALWPIPSYPTAVELFWYVDPESRGKKVGKKLFSFIENHAKTTLNCNALIMVSLNDHNKDKVDSLYKSKGYEKAETSYIKRI